MIDPYTPDPASRLSPRWSRGEKIVLTIWITIALLLLAAVVMIAFRLSTPDQVTATGDPRTNFTEQSSSNDAPEASSAAQKKLHLPGFTFSPNNVFFTSLPANPAAAPTVEILTVPEFPGYSAIWGATGMDHRGHVWMGVSTRVYGEAHLIEFNPHTHSLTDHGSVRDQLKRLNQWQKGMSQIKIHSRIVQAPDGYLYFASMDEQGEKSDGSANPTYGSYLWRCSPVNPAAWEQIAKIPQGMIAVACGGRMVYGLGYHGHVLYQFDTQSQTMRSITVGSVGGHISRNLIADHRDHVYVPRLVKNAADNRVRAVLVELDAKLNEVAATELEHYITPTSSASHGIVAVQPLADGSIIFTTHGGMLYKIAPHITGAAAASVRSLGFIHPQGSTYVPTLFTSDGKTNLHAVSLRGEGFDWITFDLASQKSTLLPLPLKYPDQRKLFKHLLYGCMTRDATGSYFVVGTDQNLDRPVILRLVPR